MKHVLIILSLGLTACGGVSDDDLLIELDAKAVDEICDDIEKDFDDEPYTCDDNNGGTIEFTPTFTRAECIEEFSVSEDCTATYADYKDCNRELDDRNNCESGPELPTACDWLADCRPPAG